MAAATVNNTPATLAEALVAFQASAPKIERNKTVKVATKSGGSYTFDYAPQETITAAIQKPMGDVGLGCIQMLSHLDGKPSLRTVLIHSSGQTMESEFPIPVHGNETAQELGSLLTYMKRYALIACLGLATEDDDDGNVASGNTAHVQRKDAAAGGAGDSSLSGDEERLTASLLAAAEQLNVKDQTVEFVEKSKASRSPAEHVAWLRKQLATAEQNLASEAP